MSDEPVVDVDPSLEQIRVGYLLDYEDCTWTVVRQARFAHQASQSQAYVDRWTLAAGDEALLLEHGPGGTANFRLLRRATLADVTVDGKPFPKEVQNGDAPDAIKYQGARYERTETHARARLQAEHNLQVRSGRSLVRAQLDRKLGGVLGGIAASLNVSSGFLRAIALLGILGLLIAGLTGWGLSSVVWGGIALAVVGVYAGAVYALPDASLSKSMDKSLSHYWVYEGADGVVALECWDDRDWRAYEGGTTTPDEFENILPGERRREETDPEAGSGTALPQLQEGALVDYDGSTWEVIRHTTYEGGKGPIDQWTLQHGADIQVLEHEDDAGDLFRLSAPVDLANVTIEGQPFLNAVPDQRAPSTVEYQGSEYVLAEEDARMSPTVPTRRVDFWARSRTDQTLTGVLGGIAEQTDVDANFLRKAAIATPLVLSVVNPVVLYGLGLGDGGAIAGCLGTVPAMFIAYLLVACAMPIAPSVRSPSHYWRYESDDGILALECRGENDWSAHAGREVAPHEFENILPQAEEGGLSTFWDLVGVSDSPTYTEMSGSTTLHQIREGYLVDYDLQTWTVADHTMYPYEGWPTDVWTLEHEGDERELEYDRTEGGTFRLYKQVPVSGVTVDETPVAEAVGRGGTPPDEIEYSGTAYVITEKDARVHDEGRVREGEEDHISFLARSLTDKRFLGACGGIARHLRLPSWLVRLVVGTVVVGLVAGTITIVLFTVPELLFENLKGSGVAILVIGWVYYNLFAAFVPKAPPKVLSHYWVYESDEGVLLALRRGQGEWTARAGREVEPYEFNNILPPSDG